MTWKGKCAKCDEPVKGFGQIPIPKPGEKLLCLLCLGLAGWLLKGHPNGDISAKE